MLKARSARIFCRVLFVLFCLGSFQSALALDEAATEVPVESIPELTARVKKSLVVVRAATRTGTDEGLGSGFAIGDSGLIVTARHVIGDGRDIVVELPDGKSVRATEVHASSSQLDLAVVRIASTSLPPLELGNAHLITQGRDILAMGHPRGFRNSVVTGVISGRHELEGISMIQLAMPIEPGNSGGPVVDRHGRVLGIVTMKSTASDNLGFAIPVDLLHELLDDPNPIPIERWRTIGALDPLQWTVHFGALWRQRAGRIFVAGQGTSFGGRSLCLSTNDPRDSPLELQVSVKLENESGAAGLVFHADGGDRHYGFYPSGGNLRLTRFDGPDVESWTILHNAPHPAYRAGGWNTLRVSIADDKFTCFVNGVKVVESDDSVIPPGRVGLAAFRGTEAEFRGFSAGEILPSSEPNPEVLQILQQAAKTIRPDSPPDGSMVSSLIPVQDHTTEFFRTEADKLELLARQMRRAGAMVHEARIQLAIVNLLKAAEDGDTSDSAPDTSTQSEISAKEQSEPFSDDKLLQAALLIAKLDNEEVDVDAYLKRVDQMAAEIVSTLPENATAEQRLTALDQYLFEKNGFRGSRFEYYVKSNSYVNEVIDDREGLPITLSVVYISMARRLGLNVTGIGLPGHFVVRYQPEDAASAAVLIDPFERGKRLTAEDAAQKIRGAGFPDLPRFYESQTTSQIVQRMLSNLLNLAEANRQDDDVLRYLEVLTEIAPNDPEYRAKRLEMRARTGRLADAIADADWFITTEPAGTDRERVQELRSVLQSQLEKQQTEPGKPE